MLELLREKQGEGQIGEQKDGDNQCNYGYYVNLHWRLPQLLACLDVEKRQGKENCGEQQHDCILHRITLNSRRVLGPDKFKNHFELRQV
jgi:hypothetical protein